MAQTIDDLLETHSAMLSALVELVTKDFSAAAIGQSERLMAQVRGDSHEKLDAIFDLQRRMYDTARQSLRR